MPGTEARIAATYPALAGLPAAFSGALDALDAIAVAAGSVLFREGSACRGFPLLLDGVIRVAKEAPGGRGIVLYRVRPGESCVITSSCLLGGAPYHAVGVAESALRLVVLPDGLFERLLDAHPPFRRFVFALFAERLAELMQLVEEVAFRRLDARLAELLLARTAHGTQALRATHQQLADELGSVREIVTRLLNQFADEGLVALGRERIEVLDRARLAGRAV